MKVLKTFLLSSLLVFLLAGQSAAGEEADSYLSGSIQVMPEVTTKVQLSNRDINRITCPNGLLLKDAVYSTEKGISLKIEGSNAFVKYLIVKDAISGKNKYRSDPTELYIVCGNNNQIFTLIGIPKDI
ncbi:type-F conjugative transfer system secretin TraK, partial [Candidatus Babeliales bacterium]|nr:type-F conjugative transfer system secretin TraK [Candidatus Babeliales bacterium]